MHITHVALVNFRLFLRLDLNIPNRTILLIGDNAQGKTSFLEALHFFSTLTSIQTGKDRQLINFLTLREDNPFSRLTLSFMKKGKQHTIDVRLLLENGRNGYTRLRKEAFVDGVKRSLLDTLGHFNSVVFLPQMTRIIEDGPDERRRYLDMTISQAYPGFARMLSEYQQSVSQRNALLKMLAERNGNPQQLDYWDEQVSQKGAWLMHVRIKTISELGKLAAVKLAALTNGVETLKMDYQPAFNPLENTAEQLPLDSSVQNLVPLSLEKIEQQFLKGLRDRRKDEIMRGITTIGPHRDEIRFLSNDIDLGNFGSRGQIRSAVLALKLAEMYWLKDKNGDWPVLLLDETLAELDPRHRRDFLETLSECEQVILTATDIHMFTKEFVNDCELWQVQQGRIQLGR